MAEFHEPSGTNGSGSFDDLLAHIFNRPGIGRTGRSVNITRLLSKRTHEVLNKATAYAQEQGHPEVDALHLLRELVNEQTAAATIKHAGAIPDDIAAAAEDSLPKAVTPEGEPTVALSSAAQRLLLDSYQVARAFGSTYIDPEHIFVALVVNQETPAGQILGKAGITQASLQAGVQAEQVRRAEQQGAAAQASTSTQTGEGESVLEKFGVDLTAEASAGRLDPVIGRAQEIEQTIEVLARRTKNNPVLIGEAGVGKTAIVEGLAQAIVAGEVPAQLKNKRVLTVDMAAMVAGTKYRGEFEERLTQLIEEVAAADGEIIIFVDELHTVVGAGGSGESGTMDAGNILKPRLARGELHMVGATTLKEYRTIEKDAALERRFQPVTVGEPAVEDAVKILEGLQERYAEHHNVTYAPEALRAAVEMSDRYITDRFLPDKAIDLIDQAGARRSLQRGPQVDTAAEEHVDVDELRSQLGTLEAEKNTAAAKEDYEKATQLRDQIRHLETQLEQAVATAAAQANDPGDLITEDDIAEMVARATGIPAARLNQDEKSRLAALEEQLHERVIGQEDAVSAIAKAVRRNRTGMGDPARPVGSFLFLGPTGVGKTELAKALAYKLFDDETAMIRFDMSEFGERHTVSRLVGAPPGYVGYDEAGQLTEQVRRRPYSVVLLDEIEKAHPDAFNMLLQVLDDGRLTDGQGRTVDFRNTVFIMTSNIGSEFMASTGAPLGFVSEDSAAGQRDLKAKVMGRLREVMRPEFINRIDDIVMFNKLDQSQLRQIVYLQLARSERRLASQGISLDVDEAAVDWIAEAGYEPAYGARPLRRVIQRELDDRIADLLVSEQVDSGGVIRVTVDEDGQLAVNAEVPATV